MALTSIIEQLEVKSVACPQFTLFLALFAIIMTAEAQLSGSSSVRSTALFSKS